MSQQAMISDMLDRRSVTLRNLRKGLRFFMDLEKKELKKRAKIERARKMKNQEQEIVARKEWWEEDQLYRPITEWTLQKNEFLDVDQDASEVPSYQPTTINDEKELTRASIMCSEETDEEFDWFDPEQHMDNTYFNFVNKNRKTIEAGE